MKKTLSLLPFIIACCLLMGVIFNSQKHRLRNRRRCFQFYGSVEYNLKINCLTKIVCHPERGAPRSGFKYNNCRWQLLLY